MWPEIKEFLNSIVKTTWWSRSAASSGLKSWLHECRQSDTFFVKWDQAVCTAPCVWLVPVPKFLPNFQTRLTLQLIRPVSVPATREACSLTDSQQCLLLSALWQTKCACYSQPYAASDTPWAVKARSTDRRKPCTIIISKTNLQASACRRRPKVKRQDACQQLQLIEYCLLFQPPKRAHCSMASGIPNQPTQAPCLLKSAAPTPPVLSSWSQAASV